MRQKLRMNGNNDMTKPLPRIAAAWCVALVVAAGGTASASAGPGPEASTAASSRNCDPSARADAGTSRFAVGLLAAASRDGARTTVVAPLSVEAVLAMASYGGSESFRRAARRLFAEGEAVWRPACRLASIMDAAKKSGGVDLHIANGVFAAEDLDVFPAFRAALEDRFSAKIENLDFSQARSIETINAWVAEKTKGTIPRLVEELGSDTVLILVNARDGSGRGPLYRAVEKDRVEVAKILREAGSVE